MPTSALWARWLRPRRLSPDRRFFSFAVGLQESSKVRPGALRRRVDGEGTVGGGLPEGVLAGPRTSSCRAELRPLQRPNRTSSAIRRAAPRVGLALTAFTRERNPPRAHALSLILNCRLTLLTHRLDALQAGICRPGAETGSCDAPVVHLRRVRIGRLAQRQSTAFTRQGSVVRTHYRPPPGIEALVNAA